MTAVRLSACLTPRLLAFCGSLSSALLLLQASQEAVLSEFKARLAEGFSLTKHSRSGKARLDAACRTYYMVILFTTINIRRTWYMYFSVIIKLV